MATVTWAPENDKPPDAAELERQMDEAVPLCQVKVTLGPEVWKVRALAPAASCRGQGFQGRDVSEVIAEVLRSAGYPARA